MRYQSNDLSIFCEYVRQVVAQREEQSCVYRCYDKCANERYERRRFRGMRISTTNTLRYSGRGGDADGEGDLLQRAVQCSENCLSG
jgi:hypothetical protein